MSREDKRQREDGSAAGTVFAFIGVTLVVLILAALAAVFIITKGPSPAARAEFVRRTADSGLAFVTKLFVPGDEIEAILAGDAAPSESETPDESAAPETSEAPAESAEPETSEAPAESAEPSENAGETSGEGE